MKRYARYIHKGLLPKVRVKSVKPNEPVIVTHIPEPWQMIGRGNYAAVFVHPEVPDRVVKLYAPGRAGLEDEVEVYRRLGKHEFYSECLYADREHRFLVLRRLFGKTLYDCLLEGIRIPEQVIQDVDAALEYAKQRGLRPHDVHGKNVMMTETGRGAVNGCVGFLGERAQLHVARSEAGLLPDLSAVYV